MAKKWSEYINSLAKQSGINKDDESMKKLLAIPELSEIEIPDENLKKMNDSFLTMDAARNSEELYNHYYGKIFGTIDRGMLSKMKDVGIDVSTKEWESQSQTSDKVGYFVSQVSDHFKKEGESSSTATDEELQKRADEYADKIKELEKSLNGVKKTHQEEVDQLNGTFSKERVSMSVEGMLGNYQYSDSFKPEDVRVLFRNKLSESPYEIRKDNGTLKVYQKDKPELEATRDGEVITTQKLVESLVEPYVKKTTSTPPPEGGSKVEVSGDAKLTKIEQKIVNDAETRKIVNTTKEILDN